MPDRVVADASLLAKWTVAETDSAAAIRLITRWVQSGVEIHGPPHLLVEVTGVIRRHQRMGEFDVTGARQALAGLLAIPLVLHYETPLYARALEIADQLGRSIPDAMYLALAEQLGCEMWTADGVLAGVVSPSLPWVKLLGVS